MAIFSKKSNVFGIFLTVQWQFSGGSDSDFLLFSFPRLAAVNWVTDTSSGKQYVDLNTAETSHQKATELCQAVGGRLPQPRNQEENDFLNNMQTIIFFLGMTDTASEGRWVWDSDGSAVSWTLWKSGEPDGGSVQNCASMLRNVAAVAGDRERWASGGCEKQHKTAVCEKLRKCGVQG